MSTSKKNIIEVVLLGLILIVLVLILVFTGIKPRLDSNNSSNSNNNNVQENIDKNDQVDVEDNNDHNVDNDKNENNNSNSNNSNDKTDDKNNSNTFDDKESNKKPSSNVDSENKEENNKNEEVVKSETSVINYFTGLEKNIDTYNDENNKTFREKAKDIFTTAVDFLFYDGEIKGYTFDELSLETKIKVLKIVASIDNKIDSYFPNYKDTIKEKYSNFKGAVAVLYLETTNKFCDKVGENVCNEAREDFNNMKESFGYTWDILKEVLTKSKDKASLILSEWYKSIK